MQPYLISLGNPVTSGRNSSPDRVLVGQKKKLFQQNMELLSNNFQRPTSPTSEIDHFSEEFLSLLKSLVATPQPFFGTSGLADKEDTEPCVDNCVDFMDV